MSPVYKKKKKKRRSAGASPLNATTRWLVFAAALACVVIIAAVSLAGGGKFKDISYIPPGEGTLTNQSPGDEHGNAGKGGTGGTAAPAPPNLSSLPAEYRQPAPQHLSQAQKQKFIEHKYTYIFNNLNDYYNWELKRLLQAAKNDYLAVKNGRKDISLSQLAGEYLRAGRSLEKEADNKFAAVLGQMKSELKAGDLPLDLAKQAEKEYSEQKNRMRRELLAQLESYDHD